MITPSLLFDLTDFSHKELFSDDQPAWSALPNLSSYLASFRYSAVLADIGNGTPLTEHLILHNDRLFPAAGYDIEFGDTLKGGLKIEKDGKALDRASLIMAGAVLVGTQISIGAGVLIEGGATVKSPTVIGDRTEIRQGAYIRGNCLIGKRCVVGHTTEMKHAIFLDDAKAGHFAYLGDSIIGNNANLGAGTKCANLRFIPGNVQVMHGDKLYDTGMRKFGAILGDNAQTGCNSVTSPGTIMAKHTVLMPNTNASSGFHGERKIKTRTSNGHIVTILPKETEKS